jgi:hypothetical protein
MNQRRTLFWTRSASGRQVWSLRCWRSLFFIILLVVGGVGSSVFAEVGKGAAALLEPEVVTKLQLTPAQTEQIQAIVRTTSKQFKETLNAGQGRPGTKAELDRIREEGQEQAIGVLKPGQKRIWDQLSNATSAAPPAPAPPPPPPPAPAPSRPSTPPDRSDEIASKSLIIPTIEQLRHPPSPNAYGPNAKMLQTHEHAPRGDRYVILTDYPGKKALAALQRLADFHHGVIVRTPSLGDLFQSPQEFDRLQTELHRLAPRYVAIAPRAISYRQNMHLAVLKLLSAFDDTPDLDVFPGYLIAPDAEKLGELIDRTMAFRPLTREQVKPAVIGTIEDDGRTRYRSYQKARVIQKMFTDEGRNAGAVFVVTNRSLTERSDFPKFATAPGEAVMLPGRPRELVTDFSAPAKQALSGRNLFFLFGHGVPDRVCGTKVTAFGAVNFSNALVFCGSCMSASPGHDDRLKKENQPDTQRFASMAMDHGAVAVLAHMGLNEGFPEIFPVAEHTLAGLSLGEAYQRTMNALIGNRPLPAYYDTSAQAKPSDASEDDSAIVESAIQKDPANNLLLILWADPALVPIPGR